MSLSTLPDDMVKKIFGLLLDRNTYRQSNYMFLALTCRRFYYIGVQQFDQIKRLNPETSQLVALNTFVVKQGSYHQEKYPQMYKIYCKAHSDGWYDECFERALSVVLENRTSEVKGLRIVEYNLSKHNCLDSIASSRLDKIVELTLIGCQLTYKDLYKILAKFNNLDSLHLYKNHISARETSSVEHPKIGLRYLYTGWGNVFENTYVQIYAKVVVIGHQYAPSSITAPFYPTMRYVFYIMRYLMKYRKEIEFVRVVCHSSALWTRMMQICELDADMKWEIMYDTDVDQVCLCHKHERYSYPERFDLSRRPGKPCNICDGLPCPRKVCPEDIEFFQEEIAHFVKALYRDRTLIE